MGFMLIGAVLSWQSEFKVDAFSEELLQTLNALLSFSRKNNSVSYRNRDVYNYVNNPRQKPSLSGPRGTVLEPCPVDFSG